jgi:hypothetical protein
VEEFKMAKVQNMTIGEFLNNEKQSDFMKRAAVHFNKNHITYKVIGGTVFIFFAGGFDTVALANEAFDKKAKSIYFGEFLGVAKWMIVGKGGWDTVNKTLKEDFDGAKRSFFQYLLIFALLYGYPFALDIIESMFQEG